MSSTNRGGTREAKNYYVTPIDEIIKFLYNLNQVVPLRNRYVLDPSAGGDENNPMSYPKALRPYTPFITTIDIRDDSKASLKADYLTTEVSYAPEIIITNPPFYAVVEFIEKALEDVTEGGYVAMLCRLNFFGSQKRKPFWDKHMPVYTFVHNKRMSFTPDGKADSIEYAHFVWQKDNYPEFTQLKVI